MKKYRLKEDASTCDVAAGTVVYDLRGHDYGLASDDTRYTGVEHKSVTLNEDGDYPSFTVPVSALEVVA